VILLAVLLGFPAALHSQAANTPAYPSHLPYSFTNLVWWSDADLRALLKRRVPGLGDEIATTHAEEGRVREALTALLKEKGITALVQSEEPSPSSFRKVDTNLFGGNRPATFVPAVIFSVFTPKVMVSKVALEPMPANVEAVVAPDAKRFEGKPFNAELFPFQQEQFQESLGRRGYLDAKVEFRSLTPRNEGEAWMVDLSISADSGPKYRVASISADGGPILKGRELSKFFDLKPGDLADRPPFANLGMQIRAIYLSAGYADVAIASDPVLDREHAMVAYHLSVVPGPLYHLRDLTLQNLNAEQESRVRELLGIKPGDVFDESATNRLYQRVPGESLLNGLDFGYSTKRDQNAGAIDLTIDFHKKGGDATVTVK
jgi:outer membrane protein insertion porin family